MEVIFNDFSIHEQYADIESFVDDMFDNFMVPFNMLTEHNHYLLGGYNTYSNKITPQLSINDLFVGSRKYPEITKIKSLLVGLVKDPYWEQDSKTECGSVYYSDLLEINDNKPNSITESVERDRVLLSLKDDIFDDNRIQVKKDSNNVELINIYDVESVSEWLFSNGDILFSQMLQNVSKSHNVIFCKDVSGNYFAESGFENSSFNTIDGIQIMKDFLSFIVGIENGEVKESFHDTITHKGITYHEFRTSLSQHRLYRIYYFLEGSKICCINSCMKKEQTTPDRIKDRSVEIIKLLKK